MLNNTTTIDKVYFHLSAAIVILIAIAAYSFYPHYLGVLHLPQPWYMHTHFALMILWMALLFAQPLLIKKKKYTLHRRLGTVSYILVPLILVFSFVMIQFGYHRILAELQHQGSLTTDQITHQARKDMGLGFNSFFVLMVFYTLAIFYRKRPAFHARFMVAAATSIVGPILDRAIYQLADLAKLPSLKYEYVSFVIIDALFLLLLMRDYSKAQPLTPNLTILIFFILSHIGYAFLLDTSAWQWFVGAAL